jgi:hypothetical protein
MGCRISLGLLAIALTTALGASTAAADITRRCAAFYSIEAASPAANWGTSFPVPNFDAAGQCGATVPNKCRIRAHDRAHRCMQAHWDARWTRHTIPEECSGRNGITNYRILDLKDSIELAACCSLQSPYKELTSAVVSVYRNTSGDDGCQPQTFGVVSDRRLISGYTVNCPEIRQRLCPPPPPPTRNAPSRTNP